LASKKSAEKAARVAQRKAERNKPIRSSVKTYITKARRLILANDLDAAQEAVKQAAIALDKAAQKGVLHPNNAARRKSRLMKRLNAALAASQPATPQEATPQEATPQEATPQEAAPQEATPKRKTKSKE